MRVSPATPRFNAADMVLKNTVFLSDHALKTLIPTNGFNLFLRKLCVTTPFASIRGSMFRSIFLIICRCIPTKISKNIILIISIIMTPLFSFRAKAPESSKNQSVYSGPLWFTAFVPKKNEQSPIFLISRWLLKFTRLHGAQTPEIRNLIQSFIADYGFPFFHSANLGINNVFVKAAY